MIFSWFYCLYRSVLKLSSLHEVVVVHEIVAKNNIFLTLPFVEIQLFALDLLYVVSKFILKKKLRKAEFHLPRVRSSSKFVNSKVVSDYFISVQYFSKAFYRAYFMK